MLAAVGAPLEHELRLPAGLAALCGAANAAVALAALALLETACAGDAASTDERIGATQCLASILGAESCLDEASQHTDRRIRRRAARITMDLSSEVSPPVHAPSDDDGGAESELECFFFQARMHECE